MLLYQICTHYCLKINTINLVFELALEYQMQNQLSKIGQWDYKVQSVTIIYGSAMGYPECKIKYIKDGTHEKGPTLKKEQGEGEIKNDLQNVIRSG